MLMTPSNARQVCPTPSNRQSTILRSQKALPKNFAQRVLDLETDIEIGEFDISSVDTLLELYSDAVEYYNSRVDKRYLSYETKMQNLIVRPEIMMLMSGQNPNSSGDDPMDISSHLEATAEERATQRKDSLIKKLRLNQKAVVTA